MGCLPVDAGMSLLQVENLDVRFTTPDGVLSAVSDVSFHIRVGQTLGIVGESGSGKTQMALGVLGLLADNGHATGSVRFDGEQILNLPVAQLNRIRGARLSMVFQDPMTSLNPYLTVAEQLIEVLVWHEGVGRRAAHRHVIEMLEAVRIPDAARRVHNYPHELSGGMRQRVMIAMALLCRPELVIADEPSTALDVTVQAQILSLLAELKAQFQTSLILISHDLGVVAGMCDHVMVMYAGRVVEYGTADDIFSAARHPYTRGLLASVPRLDEHGSSPLHAMPGTPPDPRHLPAGCPFEPRCAERFERCPIERPELESAGGEHRKACHLESVS